MNRNNYDLPIGLDSSILNPTSAFASNMPIGRGKRVKFKKRVLPFYGYYGANGELVAIAESAPILAPAVEQSFAPAPILTPAVEQSSPAQTLTPAVEQSFTPAPAPIVEQNLTPAVEQSFIPSTTQVVEQTAPTPIFQPVETAVVAEALPPQQFNQPIISESYSAPIVMATPTPTPIISQTNIPSAPQTTTSSTTTTTTTSAPKPMATVGGGMPMGGGGGGVAPASKPATTTTTTTTKAPNGVIQQKTTTTTFEKQGMSMGMKIGIVALLAVGGYLAYKNRAKLGF
jgi:hypothetical protein